jgi:hypothetical protein
MNKLIINFQSDHIQMSHLTETPITTNNMLGDILGWLKLGDVVILHGKTHGQAYHVSALPYNRKIYINISEIPDVGLEGEWPWYIINKGGAVKLDTLDVKCLGNTFSFKVPGF